MSLLIRNARILDSSSTFHNQEADVLIEGGIISRIGKGIDAQSNKVLEADNLHLSSGWLDVFADYGEPGYEYKETIDSGLRSAAYGGFTDVMMVPNTKPSVSNGPTVQYLLQKALQHVVSLYPIGAVSADVAGNSLAEMMDMRSQGAIAFSDGWKPVQSAALMLKALEYVKAFDGTVIQLPMDKGLAADGLMNEGALSTMLGMPGSPEIAELLFIKRDIELLRYTNSRLHITGVSTAKGIELIRAAKADGLNITCSVTPYHLLLTEEKLTGYNSLYKVNPPLRTEADRRALVDGLKDGTIDAIASHHRPQDWDAKQKEFEYAANGMNLQQIVFPLLCANKNVGIDLATLVEKLSNGPRLAMGLPAISIQEGNAARLTIFTGKGRPEEGWQSLCKNHPFNQEDLQGRVLGIVSEGKLQIF